MILDFRVFPFVDALKTIYKRVLKVSGDQWKHSLYESKGENSKGGVQGPLYGRTAEVYKMHRAHKAT